MILSHVVMEADQFVPQNINTVADFNHFIESIFPPSIAAKIKNSPLYSGYQDRQRQRLIDVARDAFFTSNILQLFNAYKSTGKVYIMAYEWPEPTYSEHASDLLSTFYHPSYAKALEAFLESIKEKLPKSKITLFMKLVKYFAPRYQQYFVSHAITGDPDALRYTKDNKHYTWNPAVLNSQGNMTQVARSMVSLFSCVPQVSSCFKEITDPVLSQVRGDFWNSVAMALSESSSSSSSSPLHSEAQVAWVPGIEEEL